jgi:hypothetical protein
VAFRCASRASYVIIFRWRLRCVGGPASSLDTAVERAGIMTSMPSPCAAIVG